MATLSLEKRRERKDRLLKLAARERASARRLASRQQNWSAERRYMTGYRFELAAWDAFGAPM